MEEDKKESRTGDLKNSPHLTYHSSDSLSLSLPLEPVSFFWVFVLSLPTQGLRRQRDKER